MHGRGACITGIWDGIRVRDGWFVRVMVRVRATVTVTVRKL